MEMSIGWKYKSYPRQEVEVLAKRFKAQWERYRKAQNITQLEMSILMGVTQGAFAQYLSGITPISNEMLIRLGVKMDFDPKELVQGLPFYDEFFKQIKHASQQKISVIQTLTDSPVVTREEEMSDVVVMSSDAKPKSLVLVDTNRYEPRFKRGEYLVVSGDEIKDGDEIVVSFKDQSSVIGTYCVDQVKKPFVKCSNNPEVVQEFELDMPNVVSAYVITGTTKLARN